MVWGNLGNLGSVSDFYSKPDYGEFGGKNAYWQPNLEGLTIGYRSAVNDARDLSKAHADAAKIDAAAVGDASNMGLLGTAFSTGGALMGLGISEGLFGGDPGGSAKDGLMNWYNNPLRKRV